MFSIFRKFSLALVMILELDLQVCHLLLDLPPPTAHLAGVIVLPSLQPSLNTALGAAVPLTTERTVLTHVLTHAVEEELEANPFKSLSSV